MKYLLLLTLINIFSIKYCQRTIKLKHTFNDAHTNLIRRLIFLENGFLASSSLRSIKIWDVLKNKLKYTYNISNGCHNGWVESLASLNNGYMASGGGGDNTIKIWDIVSGKLKSTLNGHSNLVGSIVELDDYNDRFASASYDGSIKIWIDEKLTNTIINKNVEETSIYRLISTSNGYLVASYYDIAKDNSSVIVFDANNDYIIKYTFNDHNELVLALAHDSSLNYLASGSYDKTIKIRNLNDGLLKFKFTHDDWIHSMANLDKGRLASASDDKTVKIWNLQTGLLEYTLRGHSDFVRNILYLGNGFLASGSHDNTINIWNIKEGRLNSTLIGHLKAIENLAVLDDRSFLASASTEGTIKIWDIRELQFN